MDPYKILGLTKDAMFGDVKAAYRKLSKTHHPDMGGDEKRFQEINLAYRVLSDHKKRKLYDEQGVVMDDSPDHVANLVRARVAAIAEGWIDNMVKGAKEPLGRFVNRNMGSGIEGIKRSNRDIKNSITQLKNVRNRLICKDGADNSIIHNAIDSRIDTYKKGIAQNEMEIVIVTQVIERISEYEYEEEVQQAIFNDTSTVYFSGAGTAW